MSDENGGPDVTGRIDLGLTEPRQPTRDEQRMMDGALHSVTPIPEPNEKMREALEQIVQWSEAYPVDIFPEPDKAYYARAHEVLVANGMTLDRLSAAAMRHVITQVGKIAREGLG